MALDVQKGIFGFSMLCRVMDKGKVILPAIMITGMQKKVTDDNFWFAEKMLKCKEWHKE